MKALIVRGSAHVGGVTDRMCLAATERLKSLGHTVFRVDATDRIRQCTDCQCCRDGHCILDDPEMDEIYRLFSDSDLLILATPVHFSGPSSLIKTVMDRFQPYWFNKDLSHPRYMITMMCGGGPTTNFGPTGTIMKAFSITTGIELIGNIGIPNTDVDYGKDISKQVGDFVESVLGSVVDR